jgi:hypothetical protein
METTASSRDRTVKKLRWTARILSLVFVAFCLFIFIGESIQSQHRPGSEPLTANAAVQLVVAAISLLGLLLAWKWELVGGIVALVAYFLVGLINYQALAIFPVAITAILFLNCWSMSRQRIKSTYSETSQSK